MPLGVIGEPRKVELHGGVKPFVREAGLFPLELVRLDPALVIGPWPRYFIMSRKRNPFVRRNIILFTFFVILTFPRSARWPTKWFLMTFRS